MITLTGFLKYMSSLEKTTDLIYCKFFFLTTVGSWDGLGWGRTPGNLQEDVAVLQSSSAPIVLHQSPIGTTQVNHSCRNHNLRHWRSRNMLCYLRYLEGITVIEALFSPMYNEGPKLWVQLNKGEYEAKGGFALVWFPCIMRLTCFLLLQSKGHSSSW